MGYVYRGNGPFDGEPRKPQTYVRKCGTYGGFLMHRQKHEKVCDECDAARIKYNEERRTKRGKA